MEIAITKATRQINALHQTELTSVPTRQGYNLRSGNTFNQLAIVCFYFKVYGVEVVEKLLRRMKAYELFLLG